MAILAKNRQAVNVNDVKPFCNLTPSLAKSVENSDVAYYRQASDASKADQSQRQINEALRLAALLTKGGN